MVMKISEDTKKILTNLKLKKIFKKINWEIFQNSFAKLGSVAAVLKIYTIIQNLN